MLLNGSCNTYSSSVDVKILFFFQAEDGIRDLTVTGVQTCALPIYREKLLRGLQRAAAKRPIEPERLEEVVASIEAAVRRRGGEAPAEWVGELALGGDRESVV